MTDKIGFYQTASPSQQGVEIVDQAVDCSRAILNGNENAALLVLTPVQQTKAEREATIKKRRVLEDKLMAKLEISLAMKEFVTFFPQLMTDV